VAWSAGPQDCQSAPLARQTVRKPNTRLMTPETCVRLPDKPGSRA
jgi:hypothetical protein